MEISTGENMKGETNKGLLAILKHGKLFHRLTDADGNKVPSAETLRKAGKEYQERVGSGEKPAES